MSVPASSRAQLFRSRAWCITYFPIGDDISMVQLISYINEHTEKENHGITYMIAGLEKCPTSGKVHYQGYVYFKNAKTLTAVKKQLGNAHYEAARGTPLESKTYCSKDGQYHEYGSCPLSQVEKGDESRAMYTLAIGLAEQDRMEELKSYSPSLYLRHYSTFQRIAISKLRPPNDLTKPTGIWLFGLSGSGKSYLTRNLGYSLYDKLLNKWWDGYQLQPIVLLDDLDPKNTMHLHGMLKRWCDQYSFTCETKGGIKTYRPPCIVFTSQYTIERCFQDSSETIEAISRRCQQFEITKENRIIMLSVIKNLVEQFVTRAQFISPSLDETIPT